MRVKLLIVDDDLNTLFETSYAQVRPGFLLEVEFKQPIVEQVGNGLFMVRGFKIDLFETIVDKLHTA